jgi:Domain of unknown function (DUF4260)
MYGHSPGAVRLVLRIEGLVVLVTGVCAYARLGASWSTFALFFLAPDLSWLGYLFGARVGAATYNSAHSRIVERPLSGDRNVADGSTSDLDRRLFGSRTECLESGGQSGASRPSGDIRGARTDFPKPVIAVSYGK